MNTTDTINIIKGNKCGHNAQSPKIYVSPSAYKRRPELLSRAKHRANNVALGRSWLNPQYLKHYKEARRVDVSLRKQRSEGRSRFSQFSGAIYDHLDLETMQLGRWDAKTGIFAPYSWSEILGVLQSIQGDSEKFSRDRMFQEVRRWKAAGYIREQKRHYETGELDGNGAPVMRQDVAHKWICTRALLELGLTEDQIKAARKASKERNKRLRMEAAVGMCSNNPLAKAAQAVAEMEASARDGRKSQVRQYYEQKRAEYDLISARRKAATPTPTKTTKTERNEAREAKIRRLMDATGRPRQELEHLIRE